MSNPAAEERHATWLELFFDLVVVAAVAQLAHLLREGPGVEQVFLFAVLYYAMWSVWTSFTLYANVSGALTRQRSMLIAMFGIAVMAASVPQVTRSEPAVFITAYIVCRLLAAGSWKRTSRVMTEWPGASSRRRCRTGRTSASDLTMPAHYLTTGSIVVIAAGLGALAGHEGERIPEANRWVFCAGAALYFLTATAMGARGGASWRWLAFWGAPAVVAPLLLGLLGGPLPAWALTASLLAVALWHVAYRRVEPAAAPSDPLPSQA